MRPLLLQLLALRERKGRIKPVHAVFPRSGEEGRCVMACPSCTSMIAAMKQKWQRALAANEVMLIACRECGAGYAVEKGGPREATAMELIILGASPQITGSLPEGAESGVELMPPNFDIHFEPSGRGKAQCPPNPDFPDGVRVDARTRRGPVCTIEFPYPAPECGTWFASCRQCRFTIGVTAAGRPDDPRSITISCLPKAGLN
jgi:hypothetical protein